MLEDAKAILKQTGTGRVACVPFLPRSPADLLRDFHLVIGGGGLVAKLCLTLAILWTVACQAPLSMGFSRQEYWSGLSFPSPGDLPNPGILHCRQMFYQLCYEGSPNFVIIPCYGCSGLFPGPLIS